jgi:hypothetical protein
VYFPAEGPILEGSTNAETTETTMTQFDSSIEWPNGEGYTPCTKAYANKMAEKDAIFDPNYDRGSIEDLDPEAYERYCRLDNELMTMQASGEHLGKSVRY